MQDYTIDRGGTKFILCYLPLLCVLFFSCTSGRNSAVQVYDYLTPQMYGAWGDGKHDDTESLRKALYDSDKTGKVLYIPSGSKYLVSGPLNFYLGKYQSYRLNILGSIPIKRGSYSLEEYGGICLRNNTSLFKQGTMKGSIERVCVIGKRDLSVCFFDHCKCVGFVMSGCNVSNIGVMFNDTDLKAVSQITQNTFLSVFYFARNTDTSSGMIDSSISFNYINGGMEHNDNSCFEWAYYNGSTVSNNFIDYYRAIYFPKAKKDQAFVGPSSYANQYQVFRYFFAVGSHIQVVDFSSVSDSFNWNDPSSLEKLQSFIPLTYKGKDGRIYEIPPYIAICKTTWNISILNAKIERNIRTLVYIDSTLTEYERNRFEASFIGNDQYADGQIAYKQGSDKPLYNDGKYLQNELKISGIVEVMESLPESNIGWTKSYNGRLVRVNGKTYRASNVFDGLRWKSKWIEE